MQKRLCYGQPGQILCHNTPRQAFVLSGSLTSAYYNKGSARGDHKDIDNLKHCKELILDNVFDLKNVESTSKKGLNVDVTETRNGKNVHFTLEMNKIFISCNE